MAQGRSRGVSFGGNLYIYLAESPARAPTGVMSEDGRVSRGWAGAFKPRSSTSSQDLRRAVVSGEASLAIFCIYSGCFSASNNGLLAAWRNSYSTSAEEQSCGRGHMTFAQHHVLSHLPSLILSLSISHAVLCCSG